VEIVLAVVAAYVAFAYVILPAFWRHYQHLPAMEDLPTCTRTAGGIEGDPLNVALIGSEEDVKRAFAAAGWSPAAALGVKSDLGIAASVLFDRPDPTAPVSTLKLWGRKQDLAFEKEVGRSARRRNHVRFWRSDLRERDQGPIWVGAATRDDRVELSRRTAQITHGIDGDIDAERAFLMNGLDAAGQLTRVFSVTGIGPTLNGRNGGGDRYWTDGDMWVGVLAPQTETGRTAERLPSPQLVQIKNTLWAWLGAQVGPSGPTTTRD
jgi:hypothetical protein